MLTFLCIIFKTIFNLTKSKKNLLIENTLLKQELAILKRKHANKKKNILPIDRIILVTLNLLYGIKNKITIVQPQTLLKWQRALIKNFWTYKQKTNKGGRPPVPWHIKKLVLEMKNKNLLWGAKKIQGELLKLDIKLDTKTIRNIISYFRKRGKVKTTQSWKQFLSTHINSIYAMDFFTVDTIFNQRFYVFFIIRHKSREIVQFAVTKFPSREFVKQQLIIFSELVNNSVYLIHDNGSQFLIDFAAYNIKHMCTAVKSPNMNSIAERFIKSVRHEALDNFIIFSKKQLRNILQEYISYYNTMRPHQGINQAAPSGLPPNCKGKVSKFPVLGGLHHHYYRKAA